jgi:hypothetical protein
VNGKFFTFPLCVLAMPWDEKQILMHIVSHALDRAGGGDGAKEIDKKQILQYVSDHEGIGYNHSGEHDKIVRGAIVTGVNLGWIKTTAAECEVVKQFVSSHEHKHGKEPLVFIASELLWSCNDDNQDLTYREFSTACAVNSVIGFKKTPVIIRRAMIIARQLGYKTPLVMAAARESELAEAKRNGHGKPKPRQPLSVQQLRDTLDKLERRDLFRRCQPGRRTVYFSTILDRTELWAAVKERVEKMSKVQMLRQLDRDMFAKPSGSQSGTNQEPLKKETGKTGEKGTTKGGTSQEPDGSQSKTAGGTADGTTTGTTKINAPVINAPLTKALKEKRVTTKLSEKVLEKEIAAKPPHCPDGGEPTLDEVKSFMESKVAGSGQTAGILLTAMRKRGWIDLDGQPVKDWKPVFEKLCR